VVWEAADKGVFALLVSDAQTELQVRVDLAEESLYLSFADKDEGLGVVVDIPDVISAVEMSVRNSVWKWSSLTDPTLAPKTCPGRRRHLQCLVSLPCHTTCKGTWTELRWDSSAW
jgi:hypothetical protein